MKCFLQDYIAWCSICLFVYESRGQLCDVLVTNQRYNLISSSKLGTTRRGGLEMYFLPQMQITNIFNQPLDRFLLQNIKFSR